MDRRRGVRTASVRRAYRGFRCFLCVFALKLSIVKINFIELHTIRLIIAAFAFFVCASGTEAQTPHTLQGEKALEQLKADGRYDSLVDAVKARPQKAVRAENPFGPLTMRQTEKLVASDGSNNDEFGNSVSLSGDTAVIGAVLDGSNQGSAYVFIRSGGVWAEQQKLTASDGEQADFFGFSVSISGNTVVIGAFGDDSSRGSAYIFTRSGTLWTQQQKLTAPDGETGDGFGRGVSVSGDTAIMGANRDDSARGSAYVFTRSGTVWTGQQKLTASDGAADDLFGSSVVVSGDTAIVGAHGNDVELNADQGAAYVFTRSGNVWTEQQRLTASDGGAGDLFGFSLAISGETVVMGALLDDLAATIDQGSAYIFKRDGSVWTEQQKLTASDGSDNDQFGVSVAVSGDMVVIGAARDDLAANIDQGSAYVFIRSGTTWTGQQKLTASDGASRDFFGRSVALSGYKALIGAYGDDSVRGSAYNFANGCSVSGRVSTAGGIGLESVGVIIADPAGKLRRTRTGVNGHYIIEDVLAGQTYIISVGSRRFIFKAQTINVTDNLTGVDFVSR